MIKNRPRGSQAGLLKNRIETQNRNTQAMWDTIDRLKKLKGREPWTYKEIWSGAGLKSAVAFNSPWNFEIKAAVDTHNAAIKNEKQASSLLEPGSLSASTILKKQIEKTTKERNDALAKIAIFQADSDYYRDQYEKLLTRYNRIKIQSSQ